MSGSVNETREKLIIAVKSDVVFKRPMEGSFSVTALGSDGGLSVLSGLSG